MFLIINAILYILLLITYQKRKASFDLGSIILILIALSSIISIFYYNLPYIKYQYTEIQLSPFVYLYILFIITIYPLLKYKSDSIKTIGVGNNGSILKVFSIALCLIGIETFIEHSTQFILHPASLKSDYTGLVYSGDVDSVSYMTWIGKKLCFILTLVQIFVPVLLFYNMGLKKNNKIIICGLIVVIFSNLLFAYNAGSRGRMLLILSSIISAYMFMKNTLPNKIKHRTNLLLFVTIMGSAFIFFAMTISRFIYINSTYMYSVWEWIGLYTGESFIRFNSEIWNIKEILYGAHIFSVFFDQSQDIYYQLNGIRLNVFYTFIGDFVLDFGIWGAPIACVILNTIMQRIIKSVKSHHSLASINLLVLFSQIFVFSFTAYIYRGGGFSITFLPGIIISMLLSLNNRFKFI